MSFPRNIRGIDEAGGIYRVQTYATQYMADFVILKIGGSNASIYGPEYDINGRTREQDPSYCSKFTNAYVYCKLNNIPVGGYWIFTGMTGPEKQYSYEREIKFIHDCLNDLNTDLKNGKFGNDLRLTCGLRFEYPIYADIEHNPDSKTNAQTIATGQAIRYLEAFNGLKSKPQSDSNSWTQQYYLGVYANNWFFNSGSYLNDLFTPQSDLTGENYNKNTNQGSNELALWCANWNTEPSFSNCGMWQYAGSINTKTTDLNYSRYDYSERIKGRGYNGYIPPENNNITDSTTEESVVIDATPQRKESKLYFVQTGLLFDESEPPATPADQPPGQLAAALESLISNVDDSVEINVRKIRLGEQPSS